MKSGFIKVPIVDGKPDLGSFEVTKIGSLQFIMEYESDFVVLTYLGMDDVLGVYWCIASDGRAAQYAQVALGENALTVQQTLDSPSMLTWLKGNTSISALQRVSDSAIVGIHPPSVLAGQRPFVLGLASDLDPDEEYVIVNLP